METLYGGTPPLQEMKFSVQFVAPILENKVFNTRSSRVVLLTAYGLLTTIDWPPTFKHNTKKEMQMCQSIVSKAKRDKAWQRARRSKPTVRAVFKQEPFGRKGRLEYP